MHTFPFAFYVDPGSGSMMLQLLLGGVSGLYVIFRIFKQKILGLFGIHTPDPAPQSPAASGAPQDKENLGRPV